MAELDREFPCTACGARLAFAPGAEALECPYCGTRVSIQSGPTGVVREVALEEGRKAARRVDMRTIGGGQEVSCGTCGAVAVVQGQAGRCAFCDAPVVLRNEADPVLAPESLLPFKVTREEANGAFLGWIASRWFAPNDLRARAQREGIDGVYVPYWTFDAQTTTRYAGQRGEHYWDTETVVVNGKRTQRRVRKTRWYPASGTVEVPFDDVLVCASKGLDRAMAERLEPWDLPELRPYEPSYVAGFVAERYSVDLEEGFVHARERMAPVIRDHVRRDIGGDEQRILSSATRHAAVTFKHVLLPIWLSSYRYHGKVYHFLVNARTGEVSGARPYSVVKIVLAVLAALVLLAVVALVADLGEGPPRRR